MTSTITSALTTPTPFINLANWSLTDPHSVDENYSSIFFYAIEPRMADSRLCHTLLGRCKKRMKAIIRAI